jgi:hypothetical protein
VHVLTREQTKIIFWTSFPLVQAILSFSQSNTDNSQNGNIIHYKNLEEILLDKLASENLYTCPPWVIMSTECPSSHRSVGLRVWMKKAINRVAKWFSLCQIVKFSANYAKRKMINVN